MGKFIDMTGERFYNVTVVKRSGHTKSNSIRWECKCDCGKVFYETRTNLLSGNVKSCGCLATKRAKMLNYKHGESHKTRLYRIWLNMNNRCNNKRDQNYENYGGRGITVCDEWRQNYMAFRDWALSNGYDEELTLDRINNDEGYRPDNCRWETLKQQANNRRKRRWWRRPVEEKERTVVEK